MFSIFRGTGDSRHIWTVASLHPDSPQSAQVWTPLRDCRTAEEAMAWVSYLNGGVHPQVNPRRENWQ